MTEPDSTIHVKVRRSDEEEFSTYDVPVEPGMSVFNVLEHIRNELDPTLAFLISCRTRRIAC